MASSYETTHERILRSGKTLFLKNGYERTNLRELCKNAGVTTGAFYRHFIDKESLFAALVDSVIIGMEARYEAALQESYRQLEKGEIKTAWEDSLRVHDDFMRYIQTHKDAYKLLLVCSEGTRYQNFMDAIVEKELISTIKMYDLLDALNLPYKRMGRTEMYMFIRAHYACIFETVLHDMTLEEALATGRTVADFFSAGWRNVLGLGNEDYLENLFSLWAEKRPENSHEFFHAKVTLMDLISRMDNRDKPDQRTAMDDREEPGAPI